MSEAYSPELGQAIFGQPWQQLEAPDELVWVLEAIETRMLIAAAVLGIELDAWSSPFGNSGTVFRECLPVFEVHAYSWGDDVQQYNFKWQDVEVSWYKYLKRGTTVNRYVEPVELAAMFDACCQAIERWTNELQAG